MRVKTIRIGGTRREDGYRKGTYNKISVKICKEGGISLSCEDFGSEYFIYIYHDQALKLRDILAKHLRKGGDGK